MVKRMSNFDSSNRLLATYEFDSNGDLLQILYPSQVPVLTQTINSFDYDSAPSNIVKYHNNELVSYSNCSITYNLNIQNPGDYSFKISTRQATSKSTPSPDYKFKFNIYLDNVLITNIDLSATKIFALSDYISLGSLSSG